MNELKLKNKSGKGCMGKMRRKMQNKRKKNE